MRHSARVLGALLALGASGAGAADAVGTLTAIKGSVSINQGQQFVGASKGVSLKPGDKVLALENASATITYFDGCVTTVDQSTVVTVPKVSPCKGGVADVASSTPAQSGAIGGGSAGAGAGAGAGASGDAGFFSQPWVAPTAIAVGVVGGYAIYHDNHRKKRQASP